MAETTTTSVASETTAEEAIMADSASQADDRKEAHTEAEESTDKTHTDTQSGAEDSDEATAADDMSDEDRKWFENKGVDPDDPKAVSVAWKKAEQEFHKARQTKPSESIQATVAKDETVQALDEEAGRDPETVQLRRDMTEMRFFMDHPEIKPENKAEIQTDIIEAAKKYPKLAADFDLETLYAIAKSQKVASVEKTAEARGRKAKAEEIERSSGAAIPDGNASSGTQAKEDDFLKGFNS